MRSADPDAAKAVPDGRAPGDAPAEPSEAAAGTAGIGSIESITVGELPRVRGTSERGVAKVSAPVGDRIGRYHVVRQLGKGGMGEVFLAEDPALRRNVAIKRILPGLAHEPSFRARLRREAQLAAQLSHRAIIQVFDFVSDDTHDHVVMEYIAGPSLHTLARRTRLPLPEVVRIATEVLGGLAYAHQHGVIHRDLKLENILIDTDQQPKIADFGLAQCFDGTSDESLTGEGVLIGTSRVMSPEQAQGLEIDQRSDLFSLGVMLYELVTGTSPFACGNRLQTVLRVIQHRPPPASALAPDAPRALSDLIEQLLEKSPTDRPDNALVVRERLRGAVPSEPSALPAATGSAADKPVDLATGGTAPANPATGGTAPAERASPAERANLAAQANPAERANLATQANSAAPANPATGGTAPAERANAATGGTAPAERANAATGGTAPAERANAATGGTERANAAEQAGGTASAGASDALSDEQALGAAPDPELHTDDLDTLGDLGLAAPGARGDGALRQPPVGAATAHRAAPDAPQAATGVRPLASADRATVPLIVRRAREDAPVLAARRLPNLRVMVVAFAICLAAAWLQLIVAWSAGILRSGHAAGDPPRIFIGYLSSYHWWVTHTVLVPAVTACTLHTWTAFGALATWPAKITRLVVFAIALAIGGAIVLTEIVRVTQTVPLEACQWNYLHCQPEGEAYAPVLRMSLVILGYLHELFGYVGLVFTVFGVLAVTYLGRAKADAPIVERMGPLLFNQRLCIIGYLVYLLLLRTSKVSLYLSLQGLEPTTIAGMLSHWGSYFNVIAHGMSLNLLGGALWIAAALISHIVVAHASVRQALVDDSRGMWLVIAETARLAGRPFLLFVLEAVIFIILPPPSWPLLALLLVVMIAAAAWQRR